MTIELLVFFLNLISTGFMIGVIWFVQVVHYPLLRHYPREDYTQTALEHQQRTAAIVSIPMILELLSSIALLFLRPEGIPLWLVLLGNVCVVIWGCSTVWLQIPLHEQLGQKGYDPVVIRQLVRSNWIRTVAWSLHGLICLAMLIDMLKTAAPGI